MRLAFRPHHGTGLAIARAIRPWLVTTAAGLALASAAHAYSVDDFDDGDFDGWIPWENIVPGSVVLDASPGRLQMTSTGVVAEDLRGFSAIWLESFTGVPFSDGVLRVRSIADNLGTSLSLILRHAPPPFYPSGYSFAVNNELDALFVTSLSGTNVTYLNTVFGTPFAFEAGVEYFLEAGAMGSLLTFKVWEVGEPEPAAPQVSVTDETWQVGGFNLSAYKYGQDPTIVSASYDDVTLTLIPEPSGGALLALGLVGLAVGRRSLRSPRPFGGPLLPPDPPSRAGGPVP